jgi:hypothetical protein
MIVFSAVQYEPWNGDDISAFAQDQALAAVRPPNDALARNVRMPGLHLRSRACAGKSMVAVFATLDLDSALENRAPGAVAPRLRPGLGFLRAQAPRAPPPARPT